MYSLEYLDMTYNKSSEIKWLILVFHFYILYSITCNTI